MITYNGENRPILFDDGMQSWAMEYDYMGRRISQSGRRKGSYDYSPRINYLYNDYLLIEERKFQPGPYGYDRTFSYLWDPTAGMASRPLMMLDYQNNSFFYTHDANKNITELVDDSGKIVTHYEYSPFGALTVTTASTANPFTFSSEYFDSSLGLIYYNYRHYNPTNGRWLSRDPIEEEGGYNLYGMVNNNILNLYDMKGLVAIDQQKKENCEKQVDDWKKRISDTSSALGKKWAELTKGLTCPIPEISCACCKKMETAVGDRPAGGWYFPNEKKIQICYNVDYIPGWSTVGTVLMHELIHAAQDCRGKRDNTCEGSIRREIEAYANQHIGLGKSGKPFSLDQLIQNVSESSFSACMSKNMTEAELKALIKKIYEDMTKKG